jgi:hypothetical protein
MTIKDINQEKYILKGPFNVRRYIHCVILQRLLKADCMVLISTKLRARVDQWVT